MDFDKNYGSIPLISYEVFRLKCERSLGIRKVQDVNATLLTNITEPSSIRVKVVFARYLTKYNFFKVKETANASIMWKYIFDIDILLRKIYNGSLVTMK